MDLGVQINNNIGLSKPTAVHQLFDLQNYLNAFPTQEFKKDQIIYKAQSTTENVYFIESGSIITACNCENGETVINTILFKGQIIGEQGLTGKRQREEFAQTKEKSMIKVVPLAVLRKDMLENGALGLAINQLILKKLMITQNKWKSQITDYARTRVIDFIIYIVENNGRRVGFEWTIDTFFPHREVASMVGSSRQTVTVTLNELRNKNLIYFDRKRLIVRDMEKLILEKSVQS